MKVDVPRRAGRRVRTERRTRGEWRTAYEDARAHYRYLAVDIIRLLRAL